MPNRKRTGRTTLPFRAPAAGDAVAPPTNDGWTGVKIGINPISWTNDDIPWLGGEIPLEVALSEGKAIGYQGFELGNKFPRESAALGAVLAAHGLELVSGWYSGELARRPVDEEVGAVGPRLELSRGRDQRRLYGARRRGGRFRRAHSRAARSWLSRLAGGRGRAGPRGCAELRFRGERLPPSARPRRAHQLGGRPGHEPSC